MHQYFSHIFWNIFGIEAFILCNVIGGEMKYIKVDTTDKFEEYTGWVFE